MKRATKTAPCSHLINTANARKQIAAAQAIFAANPEVFGNMVFTTTLDNGGKLEQGRYRDSHGFQIRGDETVGEFRRELHLTQSGYGLHCRYVVSPVDSDRSILWCAVAQTTEVESFAEALNMVLAERKAEIAKMQAAF